ncbi:hypothetical protein BDY19DRAFT_1029250 [Irpex rosettiformis]|uniref:Uncharacterized protein n=1 Tax=Irpex rosettiformis TaxID=378272 RepID=A0ACB8TPV0_9APHY|nr:hypothetical protein BDY19DRAFT_1029250 [Irpex rosettiformis]
MIRSLLHAESDLLVGRQLADLDNRTFSILEAVVGTALRPWGDSTVRGLRNWHDCERKKSRTVEDVEPERGESYGFDNVMDPNPFMTLSCKASVKPYDQQQCTCREKRICTVIVGRLVINGLAKADKELFNCITHARKCTTLLGSANDHEKLYGSKYTTQYSFSCPPLSEYGRQSVLVGVCIASIFQFSFVYHKLDCWSGSTSRITVTLELLGAIRQGDWRE